MCLSVGEIRPPRRECSVCRPPGDIRLALRRRRSEGPSAFGGKDTVEVEGRVTSDGGEKIYEENLREKILRKRDEKFFGKGNFWGRNYRWYGSADTFKTHGRSRTGKCKVSVKRAGNDFWRRKEAGRDKKGQSRSPRRRY